MRRISRCPFQPQQKAKAHAKIKQRVFLVVIFVIGDIGSLASSVDKPTALSVPPIFLE